MPIGRSLDWSHGSSDTSEKAKRSGSSGSVSHPACLWGDADEQGDGVTPPPFACLTTTLCGFSPLVPWRPRSDLLNAEPSAVARARVHAVHSERRLRLRQRPLRTHCGDARIRPSLASALRKTPYHPCQHEQSRLPVTGHHGRQGLGHTMWLPPTTHVPTCCGSPNWSLYFSRWATVSVTIQQSVAPPAR